MADNYEPYTKHVQVSSLNASDVLADMHLDYYNNYGSVAHWAGKNSLTLSEAHTALLLCKTIHESRAARVT